MFALVAALFAPLSTRRAFWRAAAASAAALRFAARMPTFFSTTLRRSLASLCSIREGRFIGVSNDRKALMVTFSEVGVSSFECYAIFSTVLMGEMHFSLKLSAGPTQASFVPAKEQSPFSVAAASGVVGAADKAIGKPGSREKMKGRAVLVPEIRRQRDTRCESALVGWLGRVLAVCAVMRLAVHHLLSG